MSYTPPPPPPEQGGPGDGPGDQPPGYRGEQPPGYGTPPPPPGYDQTGQGYGPRKNNTKAVIALVLGIASPVLGLCCFLFGLAGIAAILLARQAQSEIAGSGGTQAGEGMAKAGFVLGIIGTVIGVLGLAWTIYVITSGNGDFGLNTTP